MCTTSLATLRRRLIVIISVWTLITRMTTVIQDLHYYDQRSLLLSSLDCVLSSEPTSCDESLGLVPGTCRFLNYTACYAFHRVSFRGIASTTAAAAAHVIIIVLRENELQLPLLSRAPTHPHGVGSNNTGKECRLDWKRPMRLPTLSFMVRLYPEGIRT